ncbi:MarR family transcriptional regulator [Micromonospora sp. NPDC094482]|uniref:MarR family transcriptional regulator n=1 Tax=unclassified Micromonospora TaxID=2617518 RepID=UPI003320507C
MTDTPGPTPAHTTCKVLAALGELGEATASAVAERAGLGYSTTTAKLRAWEQTGQTEKLPADGNRTVWRLTAAGRTTTATSGLPPLPDAVADTPVDEPALSTADPGVPVDAGPALDQDGERPVPPGEPADDELPGPTSDACAAPSTSRGDGEQPPPAQADQDGQQADPGPGDTGAAADADPVSEVPWMGNGRRAKGSLRAAVLDILEAHPDRQYKTGELSKLIDAANAGTSARKASAGAVHNAAVKLVAAGTAVQTVERPATFQLAPAADGR